MVGRVPTHVAIPVFDVIEDELFLTDTNTSRSLTEAAE